MPTAQNPGPPRSKIRRTVSRQSAVKPARPLAGSWFGAWLCFGEYDFIIIADVPSVESMAAIALAVAAGGAIKASKTTALMTGAQGVDALKKAATVAKTYKPAR